PARGRKSATPLMLVSMVSTQALSSPYASFTESGAIWTPGHPHREIRTSTNSSSVLSPLRRSTRSRESPAGQEMKWGSTSESAAEGTCPAREGEAQIVSTTAPSTAPADVEDRRTAGIMASSLKERKAWLVG